MVTKPLNQERQEFSKIRAALWPIHMAEMKKFLPMGFIMFFILYNYTILRDTKDALIITHPTAGAEVIPFLKGYIVLPCSILFVILYSKLANILSRETLFYTVVSGFLVFFALFAFYFYPHQHDIHPDPAYIQALKDAYPNFKFIFPVYGLWTYSAFYVLSELWGSVGIALLFWQFANEITRTPEAKRFYAMFGLIANFSLIASGFTVRYLSAIRESMPAGVDAWGVSLNYMMSAVVLAGIGAMVVYRWMNSTVLTDPRYYDAAETIKSPTKEKKPKLSVLESFKYLFTSKYLGLIAILVLAYGLSINLVEIVWKKQLGLQYPNPNDYSAFMGGFSATTGVATILIIMLFKGVVGKYGWFRGAIITPVMVLVTAIAFFSFIFFNEWMSPMVAAFGTTAGMMAVWIGAAQNILSKGTKYSLFDPTKEMAYIPLDQELKVKGKAAVDVIGGRLGKAGGGYVVSTMLMVTAGSIASVAPYLAVVVVIVTLAWMYAVSALNRQYNNLINKPQGNGSNQPQEKKVA
jgi:AAA family ATP:ADP antiporter